MKYYFKQQTLSFTSLGKENFKWHAIKSLYFIWSGYEEISDIYNNGWFKANKEDKAGLNK